MKKILIIIFIVLLLSSCFGKEENKEKSVNKKIEKSFEKIKKEKEKKERIIENIEIEKNPDKSLKKETQDFLDKVILGNYSSIKDIDCQKFKYFQTKDFCIYEKEKYFKSVEELKNNKVEETKEIDKENKKILLEILENPNELKDLNCRHLINEKNVEQCNKAKKNIKILKLIKKGNGENN